VFSAAVSAESLISASASASYANGGGPYEQEGTIMRAPARLAVVLTIIVGFMPAVSAGHAQGPVPIHEETAGLLSQATIPPALARLTAFGEVPGAQLIAAEIRQQGNRLVYAFELNFAGRSGNEQVQIDARTGQILCVEYTVDPDPRRHLAPTAPDELVSLVESSFAAARDSADGVAKGAHILGCKLRVEQNRAVYVFDLEIGGQHVLQQALIDANTGTVISTPQPR
jgi:uncharacterized membrane protein YkoI